VVGYWAAPARLPPTEAEPQGRTLTFELETITPGAPGSDYALAPDGQRVAWIDREGLHVRSLDALEKRTLIESPRISTRAADLMHSLTWSPDGKTIAYSTAEEIWRVDTSGGAPVLVAEGGSFARQANILAWSPDDLLVVADPSSGGLVSVPAGGGTLAPVEMPGLEDTTHYDGLAYSPAGDLLLVRHREDVARADTLSLLSDGELSDLATLTGWTIASVDFTSDAIWLVRQSDGNSSIWRAAYAAESRSITGEPALVRNGAAGVCVNERGTSVLVLEQGRPESELVWIDHEGDVEPFGRTFDGEFVMVSLTHDGRQVVANHFGSKSEVWSYDLERQIMLPLCEFDEPTATAGGTLPDGRLLATEFGTLVTYAYPLEGRGERERIVQGAVVGVSDDGSFAVVYDNPMTGAPKLLALELGTDGELIEVRDSVAMAGGVPALSHDGRWVTFTTDRSGEVNVALTRFPSGEGEWLVSVDGGRAAWFEADDSTIYFQRGGTRQGMPLEIWSVSFQAEPEVRLGAPELLLTLEGEIEVFEYHAPTRRFVGTRLRTSPERRIVVETVVR
jgi:dipeptidyl aminopeptidase/acylaminoacyl peptidase